MEIGASTLSSAYTQVSQAAKTVPENEANESRVAESSESSRTQINEGENTSNSGRLDVYA